MKKVLGVYGAPDGHWVGDGFPVRSLFSYDAFGGRISPFLLLDYAAPHRFEPAATRRGVGRHPHRGFETVTIVFDGEVEHRDSTGRGGTIGPGDVQWMTAAGGILHEEYHSPAFTRAGGTFHMVQLWLNLPAKDKMTPPSYQSIADRDIPAVDLPGGAGRLRVIAGDYQGHAGPARTFTPINVWDLRLNGGATIGLDLPEGHTSMLVVLGGKITVNGTDDAGEAATVLLERDGRGVEVEAAGEAGGEATVLVLTGEPIDEPIAGYGPFVMNTDAEIRQAVADFNAGRFGVLTAA